MYHVVADSNKERKLKWVSVRSSNMESKDNRMKI